MSTPQSPVQGKLRTYIWFLALLWTMIVLTFVTLFHWQTDHKTMLMAQAQAESSFNRDVVYRQWNAAMGGVYVPTSEDVPPNPHLDLPHSDVTTDSGMDLTLINPAYMTRLVHERGFKTHGLRSHITSLNPIRPENAPDRWETVALEQFETGKDEIYSIETVEGEPHLRFMGPLVTEKSCLKCHAQQGYREGDIRGGISVAVPMEPLWAIARPQKISASIAIALLWLLGLGGIVFGGRQVAGRLRERARGEQQIMQFRRMEAVGTLAGGIAHNFNNIMSVILGNTELARDQLEQSSPAGSKLDVAITAILEAREMVRQLVGFSRKSTESRHELELTSLLREALDMIRMITPSSMDVTLEEETNVPPVEAEPDQIREILILMSNNAFQAMEDDPGVLRLTVEGVRLKGNEAAAPPDLPPGRYARLTLSDSGHGIDTDDLERIFDPYFTTKDVGQGTGMGLAVVHGIMRRHGGAIQVTSVPGRGATFELYFPAVDDS